MTRKEETNQAAQEYIHSTLVDSPYIRTTAFRAGAEWADKHPKKDLVEINKIYVWLSDFLDKCYIEDRGEAEEINPDLVLKSFLKVVKGEITMASIINLNGIDYIEIPAKTNDKICKDCEYFLNNGKCTLDECPCKNDNGILKQV